MHTQPMVLVNSGNEATRRGREALPKARRPARGRFAGLAHGLSELTARILPWVTDGAIFALALAAAYWIRFDGPPQGPDMSQLLLWLPVLVGARLLVNRRAGVYRFIGRFVCLSDAVVIAGSLAAVSAALLGVRLLYPSDAPFASLLRLPLGIIALEFFQSLAGTSTARAVLRLRHERRQRQALGAHRPVKRILLYGAGRAGILLARELAGQSEIAAVGFLDDDPKKLGTIISGLPVLGNGDGLERIARKSRVDEVVISMATASSVALSEIVSRCRRIPIPAKIVPSMTELVKKEASISHVRDIRIEDLLGRGPVTMEGFTENVLKAYRGKRILVTGAGGSIGSELTRQLLQAGPRKIFLLDKDENAIYDLEQELKFRDPEVPIEPLIADMKLRERLFAVFADARPEIVFHAAAHKHVPLMEKHPCEAVLNNVLGTKNVLDACGVFAVKRFLFISTDKAVNPTNIMGATKRIGEKLVSTYLSAQPMHAACVRFGNVMGSRGSVIPLFQRQIEKGGPVTVTDPGVVRFFMTIPEAVQLVLCAATIADGGEVFVLDMGSPRKILDLAHQMILLSGLQPGKDIPIAITGLRPGEKMYEELVGNGEALERTRFEKISTMQQTPFDIRNFREDVGRLVKAAQRNDPEAVYRILSEMELGFAPLVSLPERPRLARVLQIAAS